jgi:hypothetical protein
MLAQVCRGLVLLCLLTGWLIPAGAPACNRADRRRAHGSFALLIQSIVITPVLPRGSSTAAAPEPVVRARGWSSYLDMIVRLRRVLITAQFPPRLSRSARPEEIRAMHLAWAQLCIKRFHLKDVDA